MNIAEICRTRRIAPFAAATPLLVPSFSSRGFPDLTVLYELFRDYVPDSSLVSAFDMHYGYFPEPGIYGSDVVFVDSGGYEARPLHDVGEPYLDDSQARPWSLQQYEAVLRTLQPLAHLVVVNFDLVGPRAIQDQVTAAQQLWAQYPKFAGDFLCKPEAEDDAFLNIRAIAQNCWLFRSFSLLGLTEKELGASLIERCRNLITLRKALSKCGLDLPVHVFGCLNPGSVLAYFLCGADVFDGLAWLRYGMADQVFLYHADMTVIKEQWEHPDRNLYLIRSVDNLAALQRLTRRMTAFCESYTLDGAFADWPYLPQVKALVTAAGIEF